jgi:hypothetical protein
MLRIEVTDDGHGGADPAGGTGLLGVERRLSTFDGILSKHCTSIFTKLDLPPSETDNRRVLAVLAFLNS